MLMLSSSEIESIVRIVVARLRSLDAAPTSNQKAMSGESPTGVIPTNIVTLRLSGPLVTLEDLRSIDGSTKTLEVEARTVITPAVRDELRLRKIELQRVAPNSTAKDNTDRVGQIILATTKQKAKTLSSVLERGNTPIDVLDCEDLTEIRKHWSKSNYCICCTNRPYAAVQSFAELESARIVQLTRLSDLANAIQQASPNIFVLDERDWSAVAISNLMRELVRRTLA